MGLRGIPKAQETGIVQAFAQGQQLAQQREQVEIQKSEIQQQRLTKALDLAKQLPGLSKNQRKLGVGILGRLFADSGLEVSEEQLKLFEQDDESSKDLISALDRLDKAQEGTPEFLEAQEDIAGVVGSPEKFLQFRQKRLEFGLRERQVTAQEQAAQAQLAQRGRVQQVAEEKVIRETSKTTFTQEKDVRTAQRQLFKDSGLAQLKRNAILTDQAIRNPSGITDQALVRAFVSQQDNSVVREGEFAITIAAAGFLERLETLGAKIKKGRFLSEPQRNLIIQLMREQFVESIDNIDAQQASLRDTIQRFGLSPTVLTAPVAGRAAKFLEESRQDQVLTQRRRKIFRLFNNAQTPEQRQQIINLAKQANIDLEVLTGETLAEGIQGVVERTPRARR